MILCIIFHSPNSVSLITTHCNNNHRMLSFVCALTENVYSLQKVCQPKIGKIVNDISVALTVLQSQVVDCQPNKTINISSLGQYVYRL